MCLQAWPPGPRGPYGLVLGQPVRDVQAADLCSDLLPVAWLGDPNGCEVLGRAEAHLAGGSGLSLGLSWWQAFG